MNDKAILLLLLAISSAFVLCNAGGGHHGKSHGKKHKEVHTPRLGILRQDYYKDTCPNAEQIVRTITNKHVAQKNSVAAKLLRLHYHDCFVRGCDASILLDSTPNNPSEKEGIPNRTLEGYEIIDEIKTAIEKECHQIVSCADILALSARDAVSYQFKKPMWKVLTGRRDGTVSKASEALIFLPSPFSNYTTLRDSFALMGLNEHDLVTLSGAHTIGVAHCGAFRERLFNFTGKGDQDPTIDPTYADFLKSRCQSPTDKTTTTDMDPGSSESLDPHYYVTLNKNKGLFASDAALLTDKNAKAFAQGLLKPKNFYKQFAISMQNMGAVQILNGDNGEIRKNCHVVNS